MTAGDYQREAAEKDREYDSTASALEGKRELNAEETARLKQLWKKLVRMPHPGLHEHDPEKRGYFGRLGGRVGDREYRCRAAGGAGAGDRGIESRDPCGREINRGVGGNRAVLEEDSKRDAPWTACGETPNTGGIGYKLREFNRRWTGFTQINWMKM